jgi:hypothetical protein
MNASDGGRGMRAMVRLWVVLLCVVSITMAGCANAPQRPREITLAGIVVDGDRVARPDESGLVQVNRNGAWIETRPGMALREGDWITTGPTAFALIRYPSGSEIYMHSNTRGRIGSFSEMVGEVFAKIRGVFAVQTTFVKAGAEGTAYSVRATQAGDYAVVVLDGTVRLSSLGNSWPSLALGPGTMASGRPQVPPRPTGVSAAELVRSHAWVERMEKLLPAPSHTSASDAGKILAVAGLIAIIAASQSGSGSDELTAPTELTAPAAVRDPARPGPCAGAALAWKPVSGARDYAVTLDPAPVALSRSSVTPGSPLTLATGSPKVTLPAGLYGLYRWHVVARNGSKASPPSEISQVACSYESRLR